MAKPSYQCPKCNGTSLGVCVLTSARLEQDADGNIQTIAEGDHEWDATHSMWCNDCGMCDAAVSFYVKQEEKQV